MHCLLGHLDPEMGFHLLEWGCCRDFFPNLVPQCPLQGHCVVDLSSSYPSPETSKVCTTGIWISHLWRRILVLPGQNWGVCVHAIVHARRHQINFKFWKNCHCMSFFVLSLLTIILLNKAHIVCHWIGKSAHSSRTSVNCLYLAVLKIK